MIGNLARKRTNLVAMAALLALVAAMFVSLQPASAAPLGACNASGTSYLVSTTSDTCTIQPANDQDTVADNEISSSNTSVATVGQASNVITITAAGSGSATITDNNGTTDDTTDDRVFKVVVLDGTDDSDATADPPTVDQNYVDNAGAGAVIEFSDTDAVVAPGKIITVNVAMRHGGNVDVALNGGGLNFIYGFLTPATLSDDALVPQVRLNANVPTTDAPIDLGDRWIEPTKVDGVARSAKFNLFTGTTAGEFTISATIGIVRDGSAITASKTLTVGDPGDAVAEVALKLSTRGTADTTDDETASTAKNTTIELEYEVLNSRGERANSADLSVVQVSASDGLISVGSGTDAQTNQAGGVTFSEANRKAKGTFTVGSKQNKERSITVTITAIAGANLATDEITLSFTGPLDALTVDTAGVGTMHSSNTTVSTDKADDDEDALDKRDTLVFKFSGTDSSGNPIALSKPNATVTSKATGKTVHSSQIAIDVTEAISDRGYNRVTLNNNAAPTSPLATGTYILTVASSATKKDSVEFTIAGGVDSVAVEADDTAPDALADIVNVSATITDADGNAVADGTEVMWNTSDTKVLQRTGETGTVKTKGGMSSATFVAVGPGTSVVTAVSGGKSAAAVIVSTAGAVAVEEPEPEAVSLDCLSSTNGFATYTCDVDSTASELFALVSSRGASAIHLWNGTNWVRYSVVEGAEVPGSTDFPVMDDDILFISN